MITRLTSLRSTPISIELSNEIEITIYSGVHLNTGLLFKLHTCKYTIITPSIHYEHKYTQSALWYEIFVLLILTPPPSSLEPAAHTFDDSRLFRTRFTQWRLISSRDRESKESNGNESLFIPGT